MVRSTSSQTPEGQDSSPTSTLLPEMSWSENDTLVESDAHQSHLLLFSPTLFLLTFFVVLVTTGLGAAMIYWFVIHTHQGGLMEVWREGAFLLDEGTRLEGDLEAARLTGLTIASAAVSSVLALLIQLWRWTDYSNEYCYAYLDLIICIQGFLHLDESQERGLSNTITVSSDHRYLDRFLRYFKQIRASYRDTECFWDPFPLQYREIFHQIS